MSDDITTNLTIVVPAYKRVEEVCQLIDDLHEAQKQSKFAVIIISDKGPERAYEATRVYAECKLRDLQISRNTENLGIDRNIDRCLSSANTEFVMAVGDDDRLNVPNFIAFLASLAEIDADLTIVEYSYIYSDLSMQKDHVINLGNTPNLDSLEGRRRFLFDRGTKLGFLGSVAFRSSAYRQYRDPAFLGTWFNHVGAALNILLANDTKIRWWGNPVVLNRAGDIRVTSWSHQMFDVIHGWWRMIELSCKSHGKCTLDEYRANKSEVTFQYDSPFWILSRRSENLVNWKSLPALFKTFEISGRTRLWYYGACLLPPQLCLGLKKTARALGK
ncbi:MULTISPECIES: glycosyltransferase [Roseobacteraceae]|uniref:glycosyltransferase n=1 Tax=Roseobacteraceae TaxID=2854170 RepID=UPI0040584305